MQASELIAAIDDEITRLEQVRALLSGSATGLPARRRSGAFSGGTAPRKRRRISAAGRARIAAAQKARWARVKKAAKSPGATTSAKGITRPKKRKVVKKSSAAKGTGKKRAASRRAPAKAAARPATPPATAVATPS